MRFDSREMSDKDIRKWCGKMQEQARAAGKELKHMYFYYTTCPKCAKNDVVLVAKV